MISARKYGRFLQFTLRVTSVPISIKKQLRVPVQRNFNENTGTLPICTHPHVSNPVGTLVTHGDSFGLISSYSSALTDSAFWPVPSHSELKLILLTVGRTRNGRSARRKTSIYTGQHKQNKRRHHTSSGIRTNDPSVCADENISSLRSRGHWSVGRFLYM
jgi:hypothetical protein